MREVAVLLNMRSLESDFLGLEFPDENQSPGVVINSNPESGDTFFTAMNSDLVLIASMFTVDTEVQFDPNIEFQN
jgi:hypothetical protein